MNDKPLTNRIRQVRQEKRWRIVDLAQACGTSKQNIYNYEMGVVERVPTPHLVAIANLLEVSLEEIMQPPKSEEETK